MFQNDMEKVASNLSNIFLTDMYIFMTFDLFVDDLHLVYSPFMILVSQFKRMNESNDRTNCLLLGMLVLQ